MVLIIYPDFTLVKQMVLMFVIEKIDDMIKKILLLNYSTRVFLFIMELMLFAFYYSFGYICKHRFTLLVAGFYGYFY